MRFEDYAINRAASRPFGERPVREADGLVAPRETLGHVTLHEQRCRAQQDDVEAYAFE